MKRFFQCVLMSFLVLTFSLPVTVSAQEVVEDVVLGKLIKFESEVLDEERQIMVYLPTGYDQTQTTYPVLYLLDEGYLYHSFCPSPLSPYKELFFSRTH